jgi:hypothetical protein
MSRRRALATVRYVSRWMSLAALDARKRPGAVGVVVPPVVVRPAVVVLPSRRYL